MVSYELSEEGVITQVEILKGVHASIDAEVLRVIKSSPKWEKPAMKEGVPVKVSYVMPMNFMLNDHDNSQTVTVLGDHEVLDDINIVGYLQQPDEKFSGTNIPKNVLIIVDDQEVKNLEGIDPADIDNIVVLKDKAALEKYGEKGRKGVIIIKRK